MQLDSYVESVKGNLAAASAAGDEQAQRLAATLGTALEPAMRLALMSALSDLAAETTAALGDRVVELRLDGTDVRVTVSGLEPPGDDSGPGTAQTGEVSRVTLRLPEELKDQAERAAAARGVSLNTWLVRAVGEAVRRAPDEVRAGHRIRGWVQS